MNRKFLLAISLAGVLAVPASAVYAEGEDEKKPEQPQLLAEGDEEKKADLIILTDQGIERQDLTDLIILTEGEDEKKPEQPQLV